MDAAKVAQQSLDDYRAYSADHNTTCFYGECKKPGKYVVILPHKKHYLYTTVYCFKHYRNHYDYSF